MKKTDTLWITIILLFIALNARAGGYAVDSSGLAQGSIQYMGHTILIDGAVEVEFPSPLTEIQLVGAGLREAQILEAAKQSFDMAPGERETLLYRGAIFRVGNGIESVRGTHLPYRSMYPVAEETIQARLNECYRFCDVLGIEYTSIPVHAFYCVPKRPDRPTLKAITPEDAPGVLYAAGHFRQGHRCIRTCCGWKM